MAVQPRFCGRCGGVLTPGATFCGRCGTPVAAAPVAAYPAYSYPQAPPVRVVRLSRGPKTTQIAVAAGLLAILIIVTAIVSAFAIRQQQNPHQTCTANCSPKIVHPLPASATYRSSAFKFEVDYSQNWTVRNQDANGILLGTDLGLVSVVGTKSGQPLTDVITGVVSALPTATWQNVSQVGDVKGAEIGFQDGLGAIYSANLIGSNSASSKVRFAVIVATKGAVTVVMFAMNPDYGSAYPNGMPEGQYFDYMCTQFRWG
jgi:hypothetical protein